MLPQAIKRYKNIENLKRHRSVLNDVGSNDPFV